jgi:hypothetical protein
MDPVIHRWLEKNIAEAMALAAESDILKLRTIARAENAPPQHVIARFECRTYILKHNGEVGTSDHAAVGIYLPDHYLRQANAYEVLTWLTPKNAFHPNIRGSAICVGERFFKPGTPLVELIFQLYSIVSFQKWAAHAPLNDAAAQWSRSHGDMLPADPRPLKRRAIQLDVALQNTVST